MRSPQMDLRSGAQKLGPLACTAGEREPPIDPRVAKGAEFAELVWYTLAKRILTIARDHYGWPPEKEAEMVTQFLRTTFKVIPI